MGQDDLKPAGSRYRHEALAPWDTRPTQCLATDKYLVPIPVAANSQGFARDTASNPPGIFHNFKNCRLGRPGYFPNRRQGR
jgi:hypothetical protein